MHCAGGTNLTPDLLWFFALPFLPHVRSPELDYFEGENTLPVVLHADYVPATLLGFIVQRLGKRTDFDIGQPLGRTISVLALVVIVQHDHRQTGPVARLGVREHLPVELPNSAGGRLRYPLQATGGPETPTWQ
jgi:hypothetical protein